MPNGAPLRPQNKVKWAPAAGTRRSPRLSLVASLTAVPVFDWLTPAGALEAMQQLMPSTAPWPLQHLPCVPPTDQRFGAASSEAVSALLDQVNFSRAASIIDVGSHEQSLGACFAHAGLTTWFHASAGQHSAWALDPLQPSSYAQLHKICSSHVLVSAPAAPVVDIILAVTAAAARHCACILVPAATISAMHPARTTGFRNHWDSHRLAVFSCPAEPSLLWIVIFASPVMRHLMWSPRSHDAATYAF